VIRLDIDRLAVRYDIIKMGNTRSIHINEMLYARICPQICTGKVYIFIWFLCLWKSYGRKRYRYLYCNTGQYKKFSELYTKIIVDLSDKKIFL
jgi:hypothetical protein